MFYSNVLEFLRLSQSGPIIEIILKSLSNRLTLNVNAGWTIYQLKNYISNYINIPISQQRLMHHGRPLRNCDIISCCIEKGDEITILLRLMGGSPKTHKLPIRWWFGFSRQYQDGSPQSMNGRDQHVLSAFEFIHMGQYNWLPNVSLSNWDGINFQADDDGCRILKTIRLSPREVSRLPDSINYLSHLTELSIAYNKLTELPRSLCKLQCLTRLIVSSNQITQLPYYIGDLSSLSYLSVSGNQLHHLPDSIGRLESLISLRLEDNRLFELNECIGGMICLKCLNVSRNRLSRLPNTIARLACLESLDVDENMFLDCLPDCIGQLSCMKYLSVAKCSLTCLPDSIGELSSLKILNISFNKIEELPNSIAKLSALEVLRLNDNKFSVLNKSLSELPLLKALYIHRNKEHKLKNMDSLIRDGLDILYGQQRLFLISGRSPPQIQHSNNY